MERVPGWCPGGIWPEGLSGELLGLGLTDSSDFLPPKTLGLPCSMKVPNLTKGCNQMAAVPDHPRALSHLKSTASPYLHLGHPCCHLLRLIPGTPPCPQWRFLASAAGRGWARGRRAWFPSVLLDA